MKSIHSRNELDKYISKYPDAKVPLLTWYEYTRESTWKNPHQVQSLYTGSKILKSSRIVFKIKGGKYRLVVLVDYRKQAILIKFFGTHTEYEAIDCNTI